MSAIETFSQELPELSLQVKRDGTLLAMLGGRSIPLIVQGEWSAGSHLRVVLPEPVAELIGKLTRKAIATRSAQEAGFEFAGKPFELRVTAQGPDRAICVIRASLEPLPQERTVELNERAHLDRRGFLRRFKDSIAKAALSEKPLALAVVHLDGLTEITRIMDGRVFDQIAGIALRRLPSRDSMDDSEPLWYVGQLGESLLLVVIETAEREVIERCVTSICRSLREPISIREALFQLTPSAGVAILGRDASSPKVLIGHARATAMEARRAGSSRVFFFSDTLQLRSLARMDIAHELREAIANRDIRLRYVERHDLATGALTARVGYLHWNHPLRGDVRPAEFVAVAETTGLSASLSRSLLDSLAIDVVRFASADAARVSFGALRHHVLQESFVSDIQHWLQDVSLPAERLELRISERAYISRDDRVWHQLADMGIQLVVDEFGRIVSSLELLARAPLTALQLDRAWVEGLDVDPVALKVCRTVVGMARALDLKSIASGIDDEKRRMSLLNIGCDEGSGDLYATSPDI